MIVAKKLLKENIAEYILYMWQIEDTIRAFNFDMDKIKTKLIPQYDVDGDTKESILKWYSEIADQMVAEKIVSTGHLSSISKLTNKLEDVHKQLILENESYKQSFEQCEQPLNEVKSKSDFKLSDIEIMLNSIYMIMLLKMRNETVAVETENAVRNFTSLLATVARKYHSK